MEKPVWLKYTAEEVKDIILKLAEKGLTSEKIGLVLRDQYGIPKVKIYNLKIGGVLKEKGKFQESTFINLQNRTKKLENHYTKNHGDKKAEHSLIALRAKTKKSKD